MLEKLNIIGIPDSQIKLLNGHLIKANDYIFLEDPGMNNSIKWLDASLKSYLQPDEAELLSKIAYANLPDPHVEYSEVGYDSCQSHRKLSKVISEAILIGGLGYEADLLGIPLNTEDVRRIVNSSLKGEITKDLKGIARKYGAKQDFLFPGVTPSNSETLSFEESVYMSLQGHPRVTVRNLTGLGGLRRDKEWNYATDLPTFVDLKVSEDKRYYPGMGIFYYLKNYDDIPALERLQEVNPPVFIELSKLRKKLKGTVSKSYSDISVLCSAYIPPWDELKTFSYETTDQYLELAQSFHSPSYEFVVLRSLFEKIQTGEDVDATVIGQINDLRRKVEYLWSFNSPIHLPWSADLAGMSNDLMGRITNNFGDYCLRYGIGYGGKSLEVREYHFGQDRTFPFGLANQNAYGLYMYENSNQFEGKPIVHSLSAKDELWWGTKNKGFIKTALSFLKS